MVSIPEYDPNDIPKHFAQLNRDQSAPLFNRATQGGYPPVSALVLLSSPPPPQPAIGMAAAAANTNIAAKRRLKRIHTSTAFVGTTALRGLPKHLRARGGGGFSAGRASRS